MLEVLLLALALTDLGPFLRGECAPRLEGRAWACPRCGPVEPAGIAKAERGGGALLVCRRCESPVEEEELPF